MEQPLLLLKLLTMMVHLLPLQRLLLLKRLMYPRRQVFQVVTALLQILMVVQEKRLVLLQTATDSDGTIASTQWLVGGSEVATGTSASISLDNGATVVTFKATDNDGASTSTTVTITVEVPNVSPSASISGGDRTIADTDGSAGETVSFTATATDSDGTIASTQWLVGGSEVATGTSASISLGNGATVVTFKATDNDGSSTTTTATITVEAPNVSPSASISGGDRTIADTDGSAGETVSFTATATDSDGTIASTQWLVGGSEVANRYQCFN